MTHSFPTRRSSDLRRQIVGHLAVARVHRRLDLRQHAAADDEKDEAKGQQHPENLRCGVPAFSELADLRHGYTRPTKEKQSRSEEHTSELQSLMRISYAVFCLKKKQLTNTKYITSNILDDTNIKQTTHIST